MTISNEPRSTRTILHGWKTIYIQISEGIIRLNIPNNMDIFTIIILIRLIKPQFEYYWHPDIRLYHLRRDIQDFIYEFFEARLF